LFETGGTRAARAVHEDRRLKIASRR
jgi:hypothetical protein